MPTIISASHTICIERGRGPRRTKRQIDQEIWSGEHLPQFLHLRSEAPSVYHLSGTAMHILVRLLHTQSGRKATYSSYLLKLISLLAQCSECLFR
jgi:hypothetical protein